MKTFLHAKFRPPAANDDRASDRRRIHLVAPGRGDNLNSTVLIRDLSETGMMIETSAALGEGEILVLELPGAGPVEARVIWKRGMRFGCQFLSTLSSGLIDLANLQASNEGSGGIGRNCAVVEVPVAVNPSLEAIAAWKNEFEGGKASVSGRLLGFRMTSDGMLVAMVEQERMPL